MKKGIILALACAAVVAILLLVIGRSSPISHPSSRTKAELNGIAIAIQIYESAYSKRLTFKDSAELADILERKNEKRIVFYPFSERSRDKEGRIIDYWANPIIAVSHDQGYTLISAGMNEIFDHVEHEDDIIFHVPTKAQPVASGQRR